MRISETVHREICRELQTVPPEKGGILGAVDGVIRMWYLDAGTAETERFVYVPNIAVLNRVLECWGDQGIRFAGMFHSHPPGQQELSGADRTYIQRIMEAMPPSITELHFPLVLPGTGMIGYRAERRDGTVTLRPETIIIEREQTS